ncbi:MAG: acetylglutamate kinase [Clostridiales Family XIII bacterium]|jgi:acetylglutamate kinase|nr:acetylglutamate kinase [Clostridiales Family XIII bacterium]
MNRQRPHNIVVKYGGAAMTEDALKTAVIEDIVALQKGGANVVLVHGGGPELSAFLKRQGHEPRFVDGLRYTDAPTLEAAVMVLAGKVNKDLVRRIGLAGAAAAGLCGVDGGMLTARRQTAAGGGDLGFVGEVTQVDTKLLKALAGAGVIPVIASIGIGADGQLYNITADTAAARIAAALPADAFITLSDIPGVLRDANDPESLLPVIRAGDIDGLIEEGVITGGMIPKIMGCREAIARGLAAAHIIDGRVPHALRGYAGIGTTITP